MKRSPWMKSFAFLMIFNLYLTSTFAQTAGNPPSWQWAKAIGGSGNDQCNDVICDAAGNTYVVGTFNGQFDPGNGLLQSFGQNNGFLIKLNADGTALWSVQFKSNNLDGEVFCQSIALDNNGNVWVAGTYKFGNLVVGASEFPLVGNTDAFLAKFDANGNQAWVKTEGTAGVTHLIKSVVTDNTGNAYLYGWPKIFAFSTTGNSTWNIPNPSTAAIKGGDIFWDGSAIHIAGYFSNNITLGNISLDAIYGGMYTCEINPSNGQLLNGTKFLEGSTLHFDFVLNDLFINAAGEFYVAGSATGAFSTGSCTQTLDDYNFKSTLIKLDPNGCAWIKAENSSEFNANNFQRITQMADGTLWLSGERTFSSFIQFDDQFIDTPETGFLLKLDAVTGNVLALQSSYIWRGLSDNGQQIYVCGLRSVSAKLDKRNNDGSIVFEKTLNNDGGSVLFTSLEADGSGIYFSATVFGKISVGNTVLDVSQTSLLIGKLSLDGNQLLWHHLITRTQGIYRPLGSKVGTLDRNAGKYYVAGLYLNQFSFNGQTIDPPAMDETGYYVVQFDINGNPGWLNTLPGAGYLSNITNDNSQKVLVCGTFENSITLGTTTLQSKGGDDFFITKMDIAGNILWAKRGGGTDVEFTVMASTDAQDNIYLAAEAYSLELDINDQGLLTSNDGDGNILLAKLTSDGTPQWLKLYGGDEGLGYEPYSFPMAIKSDPTGNIYLSGYYGKKSVFGNLSLTSNYNYSNFVGKFDSDGEPIWLTPIRTKRAGVNYNEIDLDTEGNLYYASILTDSIFVGGTVLAKKIGNNFYSTFHSRFNGQTGNLDWLKAASSSPESAVFPTSMAVLGPDKLFCGGSFIDRIKLDNNSLNANSSSNGFIGFLNKSNSIAFLPGTKSIQISPNPANEQIKLHGDLEKPVIFYITDSQGVVVVRHEIPFLKSQYTLNISQLLAGVYYLTTVSDGQLETTKLVIY